MLTRFIDFTCRVLPGVKRFLLKVWFQHVAALDKDGCLLYMNYGYASLDAETIALSQGDEVNRYCIQLYHAVVSAIVLKDLDVLEVGCGRGGGASYIMRYLQPRSIISIDRCEQGIAFCTRHHRIAGLFFMHGDAESLPFDASTFDVVVNVESSHCYGSMERFLGEVVRVLRPGGYFLFTDFRNKEHVKLLRQQLLHTGLALLEEENITPHVLKALECDTARKLELIEQKVPRRLQKLFQLFAGVQGTATYETFRTGAVDYWRFTLHKPFSES